MLLGGLANAREAHAQQPPAPAATDRPGFDLGLRLGYGLPFGKATGAAGDDLSSGVSGMIPVQLELGYRVNQNFTLGALFQYGFVQVKENDATMCGGAVSCSGSDVRLGIEGLFRTDASGAFVPWFGVGLGYEWFSIDLSSGGASASVGAQGLEFLTLQLGADVRTTPQTTLGPFASFSLARFDTLTLSGLGMDMSMEVPNKSVHEWLQFGLRGTFSL